MIFEKRRFLMLACIVGAGMAMAACDNDDTKKEIPAECKVYPDCIASDLCQDVDTKAACECSDATACMSRAECKGVGSCEIDCANRPLCEQYAACAETKECYGEDVGDCDPGKNTSGMEDPDKDGLSNSLEASLGSNPCKADSDGDTIPDGVEDANRNGQIEPQFGESDPTNSADPPKSNEYAGVRNKICTYEKMLQTEIGVSRSVDVGAVRVAKLDGVNYSIVSANSAVIFDDPVNKIHGFVLQDDNKQSVKDLLSSYGLTKTEESNFTSNVPLNTWISNGVFEKALQVVDDHTVNRVKYALELDGSNTSIAKLRNTILANNLSNSAEKDAVNALATSDTCADGEAKAFIVRSLYKDYSIVSFVAACTSDATALASKNLMDAVLTGTMAAPTTYQPFVNFVCQVSEIGESGGMVDFFWVVDNSGSMEDEQSKVNETVKMFADQLSYSNIDYRVTVSSTDAYLQYEAPSYYGLQYFMKYGQSVMQLVRMGLLKLNTDANKNTFLDNIAKYNGNNNIAGLGYEDGIESALLMLKDLTLNNDRTYEQVVQNGEIKSFPIPAIGKLRTGALNYIIWVSDEESRQFKEVPKIALVKNDHICLNGYEITKDGSTYLKSTGECEEEATPQVCTGVDAAGKVLKCGPQILFESAEKTMIEAIEAENVGTKLLFDETISLEGIRTFAQKAADKGGDALATKLNHYADVMEYYVQEFKPFNVVSFALVGDKGKLKGGMCDELPPDPREVYGANYGLSYILLSRYISSLGGGGKEGGFASICSNDYSTTVSEIISDAVGRVASHPLKGYPIASTIKVAIQNKQGQIIELDQSSTRGWQYDASQNAIILYGVSEISTKTSPLAISYVIWANQGG